MQYGVEDHDFAAYLALEALGDKGYRKVSGSQIHRLYGDLGYRGDHAEIHATMSLAQNRFGFAGPAPVDLVNIDSTADYTVPQSNKNNLAQFGLNAAFIPSETWRILGDAHYRDFDNAHVDGNTTDFSSCSPPGPTLCNGDGSPTNIPDLFQGAAPLGAIDRTWTRSRTVGGTAQLTNTDKIFSRPNTATFGVSYDHGWTGFAANEEIGVMQPNLVVAGTGLIVEEAASGVASVSLRAANSYLGVYAVDNFDATDELTITAGARYNLANIALYDLKSTQLNGSLSFARINPMAGATYRLAPALSAYASYSEANRAPTPLELGCANPDMPCLVDSFLVSDPPLKQVVSHTIETGLRGDFKLPTSIIQQGALPGRFEWTPGLYRTLNFNDILSVPSTITGHGYFTNAGTTQRQGVEATLRYTDEKTTAFLNYTLVDATFRSTFLLGAPDNPLAVAQGVCSILVTPGAHLSSVARHRLKAGFDYALTPEWKVGADLVYASGPYLRQDEINFFSPLPSYATLNLRTSYDLSKNVQVYGLIENATNTRTRSFGTFFNTTRIPFIAFVDPRQVSLGPPLRLYAGAKVTF